MFSRPAPVMAVVDRFANVRRARSSQKEIIAALPSFEFTLLKNQELNLTFSCTCGSCVFHNLWATVWQCKVPCHSNRANWFWELTFAKFTLLSEKNYNKHYLTLTYHIEMFSVCSSTSELQHLYCISCVENCLLSSAAHKTIGCKWGTSNSLSNDTNGAKPSHENSAERMILFPDNTSAVLDLTPKLNSWTRRQNLVS